MESINLFSTTPMATVSTPRSTNGSLASPVSLMSGSRSPRVKMSQERREYITKLAIDYELYEKEISKLQSRLKDAEKNADFDEGIEVVAEIDLVKVEVAQRRKELLDEKNAAERRELAVTLAEKQREFEAEWREKEQEMQETLGRVRAELDARLKREMDVFLTQLDVDMKAVNFKPSRELLTLRQAMRDLLRVHDFEEAKATKLRSDSLEEEERRKWEEQQVLLAKKRKRDMQRKQKVQREDAEKQWAVLKEEFIVVRDHAYDEFGRKQSVVIQQLDSRQAVQKSKLAGEKKAFLRRSPARMGDV